MNWDAIGACGEIIAAIAVIGTLVYLAREVGQSVGLARSSQNRALMESYEGINDLVASNPEIIEVLAGLEEPDYEPSRSNGVLIRHLSYRWVNVWMSAQISYANGQLSDLEFEFYKDDVKTVVGVYPGLSPYFAEFLRQYPSVEDFEIFAPVSKKL